MASPIRELARAKMNLRLRVLGREEGGYHALETVFLRLDLADEVELRPGAGGIDLEVQAAPAGGSAGRRSAEQGSLFPAGPRGDGEPAGRGGVELGEVPRGPDNLCWRAARAFYGALDEEPDVSIFLLKRVPAAGGLGGGSADAAAVLRGLARLHDDPPPPGELERLAGELGSDVPFALLDRPMAVGWGRGRRLMPLDPPPPRSMLLLVPEVRVSTPEAFRWLDEDRDAGEGVDAAGGAGASGDPGPRSSGAVGVLPTARELSRWETLLSIRGNDFETPVFARLPELGWWKEELLGEGADAALLCGSGSTLCGIFADPRRRDAAADRLREGADVRVVETKGPV